MASSEQTALTCKKCLKDIVKRDFITCVECSYHYHLDCTSVSGKIFYLMSSDSKKNCKCDNCKYRDNINPIQINISTNNSFNSLMEDENNMDTLQEFNNFVTTRNKNRSSLPDLSMSFNSVDNISQLEMKNSNSVPDLSVRENLIVYELKKQIEHLERELLIANKEVENLNIINTQLNKKNTEQNKIIKLYKGLTVEDINTSRHLNTMNSPYMSTPLGIPQQKVFRNQTKQSIPSKSKLNFHEASAQNKKVMQKNNLSKVEERILPSNKKETISITSDPSPLSRICLITSFKHNRKSSIVRNHLSKENICCHYRIPDGGIEQLTDGLKQKLSEFTMSDFCIIVVGESDFNMSKDYTKIVSMLKQRIFEVQHTNVIVCVPTVKFQGYSNIYNKRVELFNKMLYKDNKKYEYCYILDSNKNLEYSYKMFSKYSGKINFTGLRVILRDLENFMCNIIESYNFYKSETQLSKKAETYSFREN
jgi:hypothetical protein